MSIDSPFVRAFPNRTEKDCPREDESIRMIIVVRWIGFLRSKDSVSDCWPVVLLHGIDTVPEQRVTVPSKNLVMSIRVAWRKSTLMVGMKD